MTTTRPYRELTAASVIGGIFVGVILNVGIVFAGLQIGFTIVGSTVGAILGFGLLRGILRKGSILEVNIFQTIASSVNTVNAGVIFTVPVLFLLGMQEDLEARWPALAMASIAGALLGVVMIIPMRRQIIDYERLRFPSAVAVATILKSPGAGVGKAFLLMIGIAISATIGFAIKDWGVDWSSSAGLIKWGEIGWLQSLITWGGTEGASLLPDSFNVGERLSNAGVNAPAGIRLVFAVSLLSFGAGFIAGRPGLAILYGTILNFWFLIPICVGLRWVEPQYLNFDVWGSDFTTANSLAGDYRNFTANKVGIGMILGGAIAGILIALPALKAAVGSLRSTKGTGRRQEEVSLMTINVGTLVGVALLAGAAWWSSGKTMSWGTVAAVTAAGVVWLWLAGLVVAQTTGRTDWSPLSGLALIAIAIMMGILGPKDPDSILPAVTIGAAICVATSMCADMMADLKTGYLIGGRPLKQQVAQIVTCWIGPGIALATVFLLWEAYAFGPDQAQVLLDRATVAGPEALAEFTRLGGTATTLPTGTPLLGAPQAGALQAAIDIVQQGDIPLGKYITGFLLGLIVSVLVSPGLGVMIGLSLYLPFMYMIVFGLGGVTSIVLGKAFGRRFIEHKGVPLAAGLIVGDALVGIIHAVTKVVGSV